jgi:hypothetical protein
MSIYLSASSIKDFISCSKKVEYRYKKPFPEVVSKAMLLGKIAHYIFEAGWKDRDLANSILVEQADKHKLLKADRTTLSFYIDMFFLNFQPALRDDDLIEHQFKIPLHDDVYLVGKIDRISNGNVYDWKTGSRVSKSLSNDIQCIVYDFAYRSLFNKTASGVCLGILAKGQLVPFVRDELYYREVFSNIIPRMIKTIKADNFERTGMFNHSCYWCQYKEGCLGNRKVFTGDAHELDSK